jgi:hypothetical protein
MSATLTKWYEEHGRHEIFAGGKSVQFGAVEHSLVLKDELVTNEEQHDLDALGIAKNAREERERQRDENARMAKLYRKHVLKEPDAPELVRIQVAAPAQPPKPAEEREEVGSFGD